MQLRTQSMPPKKGARMNVRYPESTEAFLQDHDACRLAKESPNRWRTYAWERVEREHGDRLRDFASSGVGVHRCRILAGPALMAALAFSGIIAILSGGVNPVYLAAALMLAASRLLSSTYVTSGLTRRGLRA